MRSLHLLALTLVMACSSWEDQVAARADQARAEAPVLAEAVATTPALKMRNGQLRLAPSDALDDPRALPLLLERLREGQDSEATRRAVADAAARQLTSVADKAIWREAWLSMASSDRDADVRAVLVSAMRSADERVAMPGLAAAMKDVSPSVRRAAAQGLAWHPAAASRIEALVEGLADSDPTVRAVAARGIGWHGAASAWQDLAGRLRDQDGVVRREAVAALLRIDEARAHSMADVQAMRLDPFARVAFSR